MTKNWVSTDTTTHQDHVIAHVLGSTVLGYFVFDEALYILLDIGFVWTILLDGEMGLLPHPVAMSELEIDAVRKAEISADIDKLLQGGDQTLTLMRRARDLGEIREVALLGTEARRCLVITSEAGRLAITTSLATRGINVMNLKDESKETAEPANGSELNEIAEAEHEYLHQRLRDDLGREPTEPELEEWLRQHTEGY